MLPFHKSRIAAGAGSDTSSATVSGTGFQLHAVVVQCADVDEVVYHHEGGIVTQCAGRTRGWLTGDGVAEPAELVEDKDAASLNGDADDAVEEGEASGTDSGEGDDILAAR